MTNTKPDVWLNDFHYLSELYKPIQPSFHQLKQTSKHWPGLEEYQLLLDSHHKPIINTQQKPIKFVNQATECKTFQDQYEPRIYLKGEVQTRLSNWHDFFQVLVWHSFPKVKILLNSLHYQAATERFKKNKTNNQRTTTENFLTLFDECGIIIVSSDKNLLDMIRNFQWKSLFWDHRDEFNKHIECFTFGHAMYEKALNPYIGMTANALLIHIEEDFLNLKYSEKLVKIDDLVTETVTQTITSENSLTPKHLNPFPILGVPNWHKENNSVAFYLNEYYFRKGRNRKEAKQETN